MWSSKRGGKNVSNASSSKEPSDHFIKKYGVTIFWDFENLTVDRNAEDLSQLKGNIEVALKTLDHRFFIHGKPKGFGKFKGANWREVIELQNTDAFDLQNVDTKTVPCDAGGCNMNVRDSETPLDDDPYARITDIADTLLVRDIMFAAIDYFLKAENSTHHILVITGDKDFLGALIELKRKNVEIMLAVPYNYTWMNMISSLVETFGKGIWYWNVLKAGGPYVVKEN